MKSNIYRAIFFEKPDCIPMTFAISDACWHHYPQEWLVEQILKHPLLFPGFQVPELPYIPSYPSCARKNEPYTDDFGCVWYTPDDGIVGTVKGHPLQNWSDFKTYRFPDPEKRMGIGKIDWQKEKEAIDDAHVKGEFVRRGLRHGHMFLQLCDLRGYTNLLYDMEDEEPLLNELIEGLDEFNGFIVKRWVEYGADMISFGDDLGMQTGPMLSPANFRKYIKPSYRRMMKPAAEKGIPVYMHSDGDIRTLVDDVIDSGVSVINLQDRVNGVEWIRERFRGKVCVDLDVDRQNVTVFGTPKQVDDLIRYEVESLTCPDGGLMMIYGFYPGTPMKNVEALMDAMEKYSLRY